MSFDFGNIFAFSFKKEVRFLIKSNDIELRVYELYERYNNLKVVGFTVGLIIMFLFIISSLNHKMAGV